MLRVARAGVLLLVIFVSRIDAGYSGFKRARRSGMPRMGDEWPDQNETILSLSQTHSANAGMVDWVPSR